MSLTSNHLSNLSSATSLAISMVTVDMFCVIIVVFVITFYTTWPNTTLFPDMLIILHLHQRLIQMAQDAFCPSNMSKSASEMYCTNGSAKAYHVNVKILIALA